MLERLETVVSILSAYKPALLGGLWVTAKLCLIVWSIGLFLGSSLGLSGARWKWSIGYPSRFVSFFLSSVPILIFLFWCHWPLQEMLGIEVDPFYTAVAVFSLVNVFATADQVRHELEIFPAEYVTAAKVCGLTADETFRFIQFPLLMRRIVPSLLVLQVNMLQASLFASLIGVSELFRVAQIINATEYKAVEVYSTLGIFMVVICLVLNGVATLLRRKFGRDLSER